MEEIIVLCHSLKTAYSEKFWFSSYKAKGAKVGGAVVILGSNSENLRIGSLSFSDFWMELRDHNK